MFGEEERLHLTDDMVKQAVRVQLGLPANDHLPEQCVCGNSTADPCHFFNCVKLRRGPTTDRHDGIEIELADAAALAGCVVHRQPRYKMAHAANADQDHSLVPDLSIVTPAGTTLVDVQVTNPTAPSRVAAAQRPLGAAVRSETAKRSKYGPMVAALGTRSRFQPFVLETHGAWGLSAELTVQYFAKLAAERCTGMDVGEVRRLIRLLVSLALLRGNARIQQQGVRMQLKAADGHHLASVVALAIEQDEKRHEEADGEAAAVDEAAAAVAAATAEAAAEAEELAAAEAALAAEADAAAARRDGESRLGALRWLDGNIGGVEARGGPLE